MTQPAHAVLLSYASQAGSPDFTVSLAQDTVSVGVGDTSPVVSVRTTALNGFASPVSVEITGLPLGATTSPASPFSVPVGSSQDVTLTVPVDVAAGETSVTFAASSGTLSHAAKLSLTVVPCLTGGNEQTIQAALGSAAGFADLCPGAVFAVNGPIFMGSDLSTGNRLFTAGYPTQLAQKALIRVVDHAASWPSAEPNSMIWAVGTDLRIQNIRLDGNRANNTYIPAAALVRIHGLRNKVDGIYGTDPLGSPGLEAADPNNCADLTVTNNFIGPVGSHIVRTAADPATWGDGIQIHCDRAYVAFNEIRDATDVGLMSFGGKDSVFEFNHIENWASSAFGGLGADPENASDANGHPLPAPTKRCSIPRASRTAERRRCGA